MPTRQIEMIASHGKSTARGILFLPSSSRPPGVGRILFFTIMLKTGPIGRVPSGQYLTSHPVVKRRASGRERKGQGKGQYKETGTGTVQGRPPKRLMPCPPEELLSPETVRLPTVHVRTSSHGEPPSLMRDKVRNGEEKLLR